MTNRSLPPRLIGHGVPGADVLSREPGVTAPCYPVLLDGRRIGRLMSGSGGWNLYLEPLGPRERIGFERDGHRAVARLVDAERERQRAAGGTA